MGEPVNTKNKDCRCGVKDVMRGTKKCSHGWNFDVAITTADKMRGLVEQVRKLSRSPKLKALLDEMVEHIDEIETDAQEWYDDWQSECEGRVEDAKEAEEREKNDDARITQLDAALTCAVADRQALLARVGLTDAQWSAQGGYCHADVEVLP